MSLSHDTNTVMYVKNITLSSKIGSLLSCKVNEEVVDDDRNKVPANMAIKP